MKNEENFKEKLVVTTADAEKGLIIIRHDEPKKVYEPKSIELSGSLFAPADFVAKRKDDYEPKSVHVIFNKTAGTIILIGDERSNFSTKVTGTLKKNPKVVDMRINGKERSLKEFIDFVRFNRWLFLTDADQSRIVDGLLKFNASVSQDIKNNNDQRGNIDAAFVQKVNSTANLSFTAEVAIYLGTEPVKFKCDVVCEVRDAKVGLWIESVEYTTLEEQIKDQLFTQELEKLKEYVQIEQ